MKVHIHKPDFWRWGVFFAVSFCRHWRGVHWTDYPTYRYIGAGFGLHWRSGRHVDAAGRVYWYFGPVTVYQDIWPDTEGAAEALRQMHT